MSKPAYNNGTVARREHTEIMLPQRGDLCPECGSFSKVIDSRDTEGEKRRRRQCNHCTIRWNTVEVMR